MKENHVLLILAIVALSFIIFYVYSRGRRKALLTLREYKFKLEDICGRADASEIYKDAFRLASLYLINPAEFGYHGIRDFWQAAVAALLLALSRAEKIHDELAATFGGKQGTTDQQKLEAVQILTVSLSHITKMRESLKVLSQYAPVSSPGNTIGLIRENPVSDERVTK